MKYNTTTFIEKAKTIHGDKYDYSKVEYKSIKEKVLQITPYLFLFQLFNFSAHKILLFK